MRPANNKVIVRVDMAQKSTFTIGGVTVSTALRFELNYREKSPVVACVVEGNEWVKEGDIILSHHNLYYPPSPFWLYDDLFAIPATNVIFAIVDTEGGLTPVYGNVICERIPIESDHPLPPTQRKGHANKSLVINGGYTKYKQGQTIFHRPHANYDIVYIWHGVEKRVTKVHSDQICGVAKFKKYSK